MTEFSLAPMLKVTTPTFRNLARRISPDVLLFTEMIVSSTVVHVTREKLLYILGPPEDNTVVQIGGSDPAEVSESVKILLGEGWKAFNLNCGCPSDRVQHGKFGAILMKEKEVVGDIINAVFNATGVVLSVKMRTGVDENDSYEFFRDFISFLISTTPIKKFYIHARKCWLKGLNPAQNRTIPPLNYQYVYDVKKEYPEIFISLNGGVREDEMCKLGNLDGMMIGRAAIENVKIFQEYCGGSVNMGEVIKEYIEDNKSSRYSISKIMVPLMSLCKGKKYNKSYKKILTDAIREGNDEIKKANELSKVCEMIHAMLV